LTELRRIAQSGNPTAADELIQLAAEQGNLEELRRLSDAGNATAADQLIELATEQGNMDGLRRLPPSRQAPCPHPIRTGDGLFSHRTPRPPPRCRTCARNWLKGFDSPTCFWWRP
jgi:hypothetical protein